MTPPAERAPGAERAAAPSVMTEPSVMTAQQLAYRFIRERILDGSFRGGMALKAHPIAEQLGISRMPVREALRQLDVEGLVTLRLNRTAIVTELTISEVNDLFEMRAALEALIAPGVAARITDEALEELERRRAAMDAVRDPRIWVQRHAEFHDFLAGLSGRGRLVAEIERLRVAVQSYLLLYCDVYGTSELPSHEHETLLCALRTRNVALIELSLREHVLTASRGVVRFLAERHLRQEERDATHDKARRAAA